jgi:hypothetical protein
MNGKKLTVEISRHCGWDNAMLTAEIDTDTNAVTYRLSTYQRGVGATERLFGTYANAVEAFDNFGKML